MKGFNIDWNDVLKNLDVWGELDEPDRAVFAKMRFNEYVDGGFFSEAGRKLLLSRDLLSAGKNEKYKDRVQHNNRNSQFNKAMRVMEHHNFTIISDERDLLYYAADIMTTDERYSLLSGSQLRDGPYSKYDDLPLGPVTQLAWPQSFLQVDAKEISKWEKQRLPSRVSQQYQDGAPYFDGQRLFGSSQTLFEATQALVETALRWPGPVPLAQLHEQVPDVNETQLAEAILPALRYLLLFVWMDESMTPVIGPWPRISYALHRPALKAPSPAASEPALQFHAPLLAEDMVSALIAASSEPLRLLANSDKLYAKDQKRLQETFLSVPDWLKIDPDVPTALDDEDEKDTTYILDSLHPTWRTNSAVSRCLLGGMLKATKQQGRARLTVTAKGQDWLALDSKQRVIQLIEPWRNHKGAGKAGKSKTDKKTELPFATVLYGGTYIKPYDDSDKNPWICQELRQMFRYDSRSVKKIDWPAAFVDAFKQAASKGFVAIGPWADYHVRIHNPLLGASEKGRYGPKPQLGKYYHSEPLDDLDLEHLWRNSLLEVLVSYLVPLGAVQLGKSEDDLPLIHLHPIGQYLLGMKDDFDYQAAPEGDVIIQPNFEVTFLGSAPQAEAIVGRVAQRVGKGVGTIFRITKASVLTAAAAGMKGEQALEDLRAISSKPLPDNVAREINGWFQSIHHVRLKQTWVIETDDEQTDNRILAIAGKKARLLAPTIIEISSQKNHSELKRKLKAIGIFVR